MGILLFPFCQFHHSAHLFHDPIIVFFSMGNQAVAAVFDAIFKICKISAAFVTQGIQGAVTEKAAKVFLIYALVTGEILASRVLTELIVFHLYTSVQG